MNIDHGDLARLLELVTRTTEHEIDCAEFLHLAAGYVERISASGERPTGWRRVVQHLSVCPECSEEVETLRRLLTENS